MAATLWCNLRKETEDKVRIKIINNIIELLLLKNMFHSETNIKYPISLRLLFKYGFKAIYLRDERLLEYNKKQIDLIEYIMTMKNVIPENEKALIELNSDILDIKYEKNIMSNSNFLITANSVLNILIPIYIREYSIKVKTFENQLQIESFIYPMIAFQSDLTLKNKEELEENEK